MNTDVLIVFPSKLGWMGLQANQTAVRRLSFGHASEGDAIAAMGSGLTPVRRLLPWQRDLVKLLQAYAGGAPADFSRVPIELDGASDFRQHVLRLCRKVPLGKTITYGQLAAKAGAAGAARAVGTCMARNPLPLIVPCHRVTRAGGNIGPYSAPGGTSTKRQLLAMEAACSVLA
jgi:methylated-DNA-[protein]-cysteine S-methyltransferase